MSFYKKFIEFPIYITKPQSDKSENLGLKEEIQMVTLRIRPSEIESYHATFSKDLDGEEGVHNTCIRTKSGESIDLSVSVKQFENQIEVWEM